MREAWISQRMDQSEQEIERKKDPQRERRTGPADRRSGQSERRNAERVSEEVAPRRLPDVKDRRSKR